MLSGNYWVWEEIIKQYNFQSANGVPWPLDRYLAEQGKLTIQETVYKLRGYYDKWNNGSVLD